MQDDLFKLRGETQTVYNDAKTLEARWAELQREQKELYQVRYPSILWSNYANLRSHSKRYTPQFLLLRRRHGTRVVLDVLPPERQPAAADRGEHPGGGTVLHWVRALCVTGKVRGAEAAAAGVRSVLHRDFSLTL